MRGAWCVWPRARRPPKRIPWLRWALCGARTGSVVSLSCPPFSMLRLLGTFRGWIFWFRMHIVCAWDPWGRRRIPGLLYGELAPHGVQLAIGSFVRAPRLYVVMLGTFSFSSPSFLLLFSLLYTTQTHHTPTDVPIYLNGDTAVLSMAPVWATFVS